VRGSSFVRRDQGGADTLRSSHWMRIPDLPVVGEVREVEPEARGGLRQVDEYLHGGGKIENRCFSELVENERNG
jgi:hypothetical protein